MKPICGFNNNNNKNTNDKSLKSIGECSATMKDSSTAVAVYAIAFILSKKIIKARLNSCGKVNQC